MIWEILKCQKGHSKKAKRSWGCVKRIQEPIKRIPNGHTWKILSNKINDNIVLQPKIQNKYIFIDIEINKRSNE